MYIYILKEIFPIPHRHDITEILLNVALSTINLNNLCKNKVQFAQADEYQQKPSWLLQNVLIVLKKKS
jgi:hypothetical protein